MALTDPDRLFLSNREPGRRAPFRLEKLPIISPNGHGDRAGLRKTSDFQIS